MILYNEIQNLIFLKKKSYILKLVVNIPFAKKDWRKLNWCYKTCQSISKTN